MPLLSTRGFACESPVSKAALHRHIQVLLAQAETPGTQLETLNRMEKLGLLDSVEHWLEARELRNRLVHEYEDQMDRFKHHLELAAAALEL